MVSMSHADTGCQKSREYPILILSSRAGRGNYAVAEEMRRRLASGGPVRHDSIEGLISPALQKRHFDRYRSICFRAPWLLYVIYIFPINYFLSYIHECFFNSVCLDALQELIIRHKIRTVICTNHRSCFWVSVLKKRRSVSVFLQAILTDYYMGAGWRFLFWDQVDSFSGPMDKSSIPPPYRKKYSREKLSLSDDYDKMDPRRASVNNILVMGGGWGLGSIEHVVRQVSAHIPGVSMHVVCGQNEGLFRRLSQCYGNDDTVHLYQELDSLSCLMGSCASVITKPGGVALTEAFAAHKKIFLIKGLPVIEEKNARYAMKHFGASLFSLKNFLDWFYVEARHDDSLL